jgi:pimeloyl-ACP methyl ester carboxylesterase
MKQSFNINIDQSVLNDLTNRLAQTRWPDEIPNTGWQYGANLAYIKELCNYWQTSFNWRQCETWLNSFAHFKSTINGTGIHFIHEKGKGKTTAPFLLTHGFPDSFARFLKLIPLLTVADEHGLSFDMIIPSIPGYGFSDKPDKPGRTPKQMADLFDTLMTQELGYHQYFAHGGDWGSSITEQLAVNHPGNLLGIHLTDIPYHHLFAIPPNDLTEPEKKFLEAGKKWQMAEGAYDMIQSTTPQTAAYGLNDSPAGLAAWIVEKFYRWGDCQGNIENCFTKDELLTNLTIYWATQTINSAMRIYYETARNPPGNALKKMNTPTGAAIFPKDLVCAPREFGERIYNIKHWTNMPKGGHFAAMEQPVLLAEDIRKFTSLCITSTNH